MKTFVVRLFVAAEQEPAPGDTALRGVVEEVASGRRGSFHGGQELVDFLSTSTETEGAASPERSRA